MLHFRTKRKKTTIISNMETMDEVKATTDQKYSGAVQSFWASSGFVLINSTYRADSGVNKMDEAMKSKTVIAPRTPNNRAGRFRRRLFLTKRRTSRSR